MGSIIFRHDGNMRLAAYFAFVFLVLGVVRPFTAHSDTVVLNSGETFNSPEVWEENGKVRFNMHGLVVSVNKDDVATVIRDGGRPGPPAAKPAPAMQAEAPPLVQPSSEPPVASPSPEPLSPPPAQPSASPVTHQSAPSKGRAVKGTGLAGFAWQMKPAAVAGLEKLKTDPEFGGVDQYYFPDQAPVFGDVMLDGLIFGFWRNELYSITAWVNGRPGYERLKAEVQTRYGQGQANHKGLERLVWQDQTSDRLLEFDTALNTGLFWMRSRRVDAHIKQLYPQ